MSHHARPDHGKGSAEESALGTALEGKVAAVMRLTQSAVEEVAHLGSRVNASTPGPTAMAPMKAWAENHPADEAGFARSAMLRRMSRPEEIAQVALFLASDASSAVAGHTIQANPRTASDRTVLDGA